MPTKPDKVVRVVRTIEYVGPESWVTATLEKSWLKTLNANYLSVPGFSIKLLREEKSDAPDQTL